MKKGVELMTLVKILIWLAIILIVAFLIKTFVVDAGIGVTQPGEILLEG